MPTRRAYDPAAMSDLAPAVRTVIEKCLAVTAGEDVVVVVDPATRAIGDALRDEAAAAGADALLTGEPAERAMASAREAHLHFIAAGHYATETFGVRRLGEHLSERFGVRHVFVDIPNPV